MAHNLTRPVTAMAVEYTTDRDETPAPLKPVFSKTVTDYTVLVHEYAEKVYPNAIPETGSSITFGGSRYIQGSEEKQIPWNGTCYFFPDDVGEMETSFTVYKDHRIDGVYTVNIQRRPDAGRVQDLALARGYYDGSVPGAADKADPDDPGWMYEAVPGFGFSSAGTKFDVKLLYDTVKVLIEPTASQGIIFAYTLYPKDPAYYPDVRARVDFNNSNIPQLFDFSSVYNLKGDTVGVGAPEVDPATGKKTAWLKVHTVSRDPDTGEQRYPQDYLLKLIWDKEYAYLEELHVNDDINSAAERLLGNFHKENTGYDAEVNASAAEVKITAGPRDSGSIVTIEKWSSMVNGTRLEGPVTFSSAPFSAEFPFSNTELSCAVRVTVKNPGLFPDPETNHGEISYWIDLRREQPLTRLKNVKLTGFADTDGNPLTSPVEQDLFWFDNDNDGNGPDIDSTAYSGLKEPGTTPFNLVDVNSFILELDGVKISRLRLTGIPEEPECSVTYKVGDNPPRTDTGGSYPYYEFDFSGGTGASITVSRPNHKDRVYAFTFIRTGAMIVELYTDKREPPPAADMPPDNQKIINDGERGTFQSIVSSGRPVNSVLPGQQVILRVTPKLGWKVHKLYLIGDNGVMLTDWDSLTAADLPGKTGPTPNPPATTGMTEWKFTMPDRKLNFLLQYDFVTDAVSRVAYVAPEGRAGRSGAYGTAADGTGSGDTGTCWAYATSSLQGVIDAFVSPGSGPFDEIWLLEGTYYLDPNKDASKDWADAITDRGNEINRSFVLKEGIRIYGGYKGTENARLPYSEGDLALTAARKTILSGRLRDSRNVRHVVIAANIAAPTGAGQIPSARSDFSIPAGYNFSPNFDHSANSGLTLLDTLTIRDGLRTKDTGTIQVNSKGIKNANGAGFYNVDAGPYLRNVIIANNTAVRGGGMYNEATSGNTSAPVLKNVSFDNNDATGFDKNGGDGAGFANDAGMPVFLDCRFTNNSTVGGNGAGLYMGGGKTLLRGCEFRYNHAGGAGGALANSGETWIYGTTAVPVLCSSNSAVDGGGGISQGGTLYMVNVTTKNAVSNGGTLSGTNVTIDAGIGSGGSLALVNSTI
ncbi:MAG: right-handed parallel beta-helix repeat-containing protein, partial [Treponema sp.]|nr:right-handed parallel beta-helix repeat-containing protein [Treponema sp.]